MITTHSITTMRYKGYEAIVEFCDIDRLFFGRVHSNNDVILFDGQTLDECEANFHKMVDDYISEKDLGT